MIAAALPRAWTRASAALAAGLVTVVASPAARACQSCFGAEDSPLIDGARSGAWVLIFVIFGVQVGFVAFFLHLRKRARIVAAMEASSPWADHDPPSTR